MNTFKLTVSSPDGNKFSGDVIKLDVRGTEGDLAVMAGHIPFVTSLVEAPVKLLLPDDTEKEAYRQGSESNNNHNYDFYRSYLKHLLYRFFKDNLPYVKL